METAPCQSGYLYQRMCLDKALIPINSKCSDIFSKSFTIENINHTTLGLLLNRAFKMPNVTLLTPEREFVLIVVWSQIIND